MYSTVPVCIRLYLLVRMSVILYFSFVYLLSHARESPGRGRPPLPVRLACRCLLCIVMIVLVIIITITIVIIVIVIINFFFQEIWNEVQRLRAWH